MASITQERANSTVRTWPQSRPALTSLGVKVTESEREKLIAIIDEEYSEHGYETQQELRDLGYECFLEPHQFALNISDSKRQRGFLLTSKGDVKWKIYLGVDGQQYLVP